MTTLAEDLLPTVYEGRAEAGLAGFRPHTIAVVYGFELGIHTGDAQQPEEIPITEANGQPPKIVWLSPDEIALGGYPKGTVRAGPITPAFAGGGTDAATLTGDDLQRKDTLRFRIRGPNHPNGWDYRKVGFSAERALRFMLFLAPAVPVNEP